MADVSGPSSFGIPQSGGGAGTFVAPSPDNYAAHQAIAAGAAIQGAGGEMSQVVQDAAREANQLRAIEATNQAREAAIHLTSDKNEGYVNVKGAAAVKRDSGLPLGEEYSRRLRDRLVEISGGLANEYQKRLFQATAGQIQTNFDAGVTQHEANESRSYAVSTYKGTMEGTAQKWGKTGVVDPGDLEMFDVARQRLGTTLGLSGAETDAMGATAMSGAVSQAIGTLLDEKKTAEAKALFGQLGDKLLGADRARIEGVLQRQITAQRAIDSVDQAAAAGLNAGNGIPPGAVAPRGPTPDVPATVDISAHPPGKHTIVIKEKDGTFAVIPSEVGGKVLTPKAATARYRDTGEHLGIFNSQHDAKAYTDALAAPTAASGDKPVGKVPASGPYAPGGAAMRMASTLAGALSEPVVAGFMGNFHVEGGYEGGQGDGGTASGIVQLRGERLANFKKMFGKDPKDASPEEQGKFVLWELKHPAAAGMKQAWVDQILAAKSGPEAARLIDRYYERSDGGAREDRAAAATEWSTGKLSGYSRAQGGGAVDPNTGEVSISLEAFTDYAVRIAEGMKGGALDPDERQAVEQRAAWKWGVHQSGVKQATEENLGTVYAALYAKKGDMSALTPTQLKLIPAAEMPKVIAYAATVRKEQEPETDLGTYHDLMSDSGNGTPKFLTLDDRTFYGYHNKLSESDFKSLEQQRVSWRHAQATGNAKAAAEQQATAQNIDYGTVNRLVTSRLMQILPPQMKSWGKDERAHAGAVHRVVNEALVAEQARRGRQLTNAETETLVDGIFARGMSVTTPGWFGTSIGSGREVKPVLSRGIKDIPSAELAQIKDALAKRGYPRD